MWERERRGRQKAESRRQKAEGRRQKAEDYCLLLSAFENTKGDDAAPVASSPSVIVVALSVASLSLAITGGAPVPPIIA